MIIWVVGAVGVVVGVVMVYFWLIQDRMVFAPTREYAVTPDQLGLVYESVALQHAGGPKIVGWYFPADQPMMGATVAPSGVTVLFFHGNGGNNSHRMESMEFLLGLGASVFLIDYQGYGQSEGKPSEKGLYADARLAWDWLTGERGCRAGDIVIMGRSLGGAVAVELATEVKARGVLVESSLTSVVDMGRELLPFLPVKWLARYAFDSAGKIGRVGCPVLVTHSPQDEMIPYRMGERLYELAPEPKEFVRLSGGHNDRGYFASGEYVEAVRRLLDGRLGDGAGGSTKSVDKGGSSGYRGAS